MPRRRWFIALAIVLSLLVAAEVLVRRWERPRAAVQIINEGAGIMEDLVVSYAETRLPLGALLKGQSVSFQVTAGPPGPLVLEFRQKSNALQGFQIPDFEPSQNVKDGMKQVLVVGTNQVQRYLVEDDPRDDRPTMAERLWDWMRSDLGLSR